MLNVSESAKKGSVVRWGILGTGKIAERFAGAIAMVDDAEVVAVGSRTSTAAHAFANLHGVPKRHVGYQVLVSDTDVDVVYVATPHVYHRDHAMLAIEAGKAVLCEKPFTINAVEAEKVVHMARERGVFLMEAMWSRFIPAVRRVRELVAEEIVGDLRMISADFGFRADFGPNHRLLARELGGGALLDVGVYPISLVSMLWGAPTRIAGLAAMGETGVDEQAAIVLGYDDGRLASLYTSIDVDTPVEAVLMGTRGHIRIHRRMHHPQKLTVAVDGREEEVIEMPFEGYGLQFQAMEVGRCLREGRTESEAMPLDETVAVMRTLDAIRAQWGLKYPGE